MVGGVSRGDVPGNIEPVGSSSTNSTAKTDTPNKLLAPTSTPVRSDIHGLPPKEGSLTEASSLLEGFKRAFPKES